MEKFGHFEKTMLVGALAFGTGLCTGYNGFKQNALRDKINEEVATAQQREKEGIEKAQENEKELKKNALESNLRDCKSLGKSITFYMNSIESGNRQCSTFKDVHSVISDCKSACYNALSLYTQDPELFGKIEDINDSIRRAKIEYKIAEDRQMDPRLTERCSDNKHNSY